MTDQQIQVPPGPWARIMIEDRAVLMRASRDAAQVAVCCEAPGRNPTGLGVACDLDRPDTGRLILEPHADDWAKPKRVRKELLQRASAVWRRYGPFESGPVTTRQCGCDVYEMWADLAADRVEISRRAMRPETVLIDEYLGYADQFDTGAAEIHLREQETVPAPMLAQMRTLILEAWRLGTVAEQGTAIGARQ